MRENEYKYNMWTDGAMRFRLPLPPKPLDVPPRPCADGQFGGIIKVYREWKLSGDTGWMLSLWPGVFKSLAYAWEGRDFYRWDEDRDGVLEGRQHHTLDMELFGPSAWLEGEYATALKAAAEMADAAGEPEKAELCRKLFKSAKKFIEEQLFNGSYYIHKINLGDREMLGGYGEDAIEKYWNTETCEIKYQISEGCDIDQLCGQWMADIAGLGEIFDREHRKTALRSMYKYNFKESFRNFVNPWRLYALNDESGMIMCGYPEKALRPKHPVPYCDETMHGFEYQAAGLFITNGMYEEAIRIVRGVRDRYDGKKRNPYNEIECGSNYARSMASFALIPLSSGFYCDLTGGRIGFDPKVNADKFRVIWSVGTGWGTFEKNGGTVKLIIEEGHLDISHLTLPFYNEVSSLMIDGKVTEFNFTGETLGFGSLNISKGIEITGACR
jgi:hypothetical protein